MLFNYFIMEQAYTIEKYTRKRIMLTDNLITSYTSQYDIM